MKLSHVDIAVIFVGRSVHEIKVYAYKIGFFVNL